MKHTFDNTPTLQKIESEIRTDLEFTMTTEAIAHQYAMEMMADVTSFADSEALHQELDRSRQNYLKARASLSDLDAASCQRVESELCLQRAAMESTSVVLQ